MFVEVMKLVGFAHLGALGALLLTVFVGCVPEVQPVTTVKVPEIGPASTLTYKLDKDKKQWTKTECVTKYDAATRRIEGVCHEQMISAPPADMEKRLAE